MTEIRAYKREWMRRWRKLHPLVNPKKRGGSKPGRKKKGHCIVCSILLTSKYAGDHDGITCEECLNR